MFFEPIVAALDRMTLLVGVAVKRWWAATTPSTVTPWGGMIDWFNMVALIPR